MRGALTLAVLSLVALAACSDSKDRNLDALSSPTPPLDAIVVGSFYVVEDDGWGLDQIPTVCESEAVDDVSLLMGSPFASRRFPDFTRVYTCKNDSRVTAAVVRSSPAYLRYEFMGLPVVEWSLFGDREYTQLDIGGMEALLIAQSEPDLAGHSAAIYVIEELPTDDRPGRMAALRFVSPERSICFMRQILDLDAPGPC